MKRKILIIASAIVAVSLCIIGYTQATSKTSAERAQQREQRHIEREKRRAQRQAEYEKYIDSIVLVRNFQFSPQSMQQQPAGPMRLLNNPNFGVQVWGSENLLYFQHVQQIPGRIQYILNRIFRGNILFHPKHNGS